MQRPWEIIVQLEVITQQTMADGNSMGFLPHPVKKKRILATTKNIKANVQAP